MVEALSQDTLDELARLEAEKAAQRTSEKIAAEAKAKEDAEAAAKKGDEEGAQFEAGDPTKETRSKTLNGAGYTSESISERLTKDKGVSQEFINELKDKLDPDIADIHISKLKSDYELETIKSSDSYVDKSKAAQEMNEFIYKEVGGKDNFKEIGKALQDSMSATELEVLNAKLASGNEALVKEGLDSAVKKYNNTRGMGGKLMVGDAGNTSDPEVHITKDEFQRIMQTEKYKTDPAYARKIDADRLKTRERDSIQYGAGMYYGMHPEKGRYAL